MALLAVLGGAEGWVDVAHFGRRKLGFLRRFLPYKDGTPSHDQLGNVFAALGAECFQRCFIAWVEAVHEACTGVVAIDGKTLRRSFDRASGKATIHMVSAWSSSQGLVLGQRKVDDKSNEITAIPDLLDLLTLNGAIVTIDAMGCQKNIAARIINRNADYILALKGNQGTLRDDVELFFTEQEARDFADTRVFRHTTTGKDHGRLEIREYAVCADIEWLRDRHPWSGLNAIVMVRSRREFAGKTEIETRFYITSLTPDAPTIATAIRQHWGVENGLHWVMDMVFRDDECRIRKKNAPANFATVKHMASNVLRDAPHKHSLRLKRKLAGWDDQFLFELITR